MMPKTKMITGIIMIVSILIWIIWDFIVGFNGTKGDTISEIGLWVGRLAPVIAMAVGVIVAHIFVAPEALKPALVWIQGNLWLPLIYGLIGGALFWNQLR